MSNLAETILRDVPIRGRMNAGRKCLDELVFKKDVEAALTAALAPTDAATQKGGDAHDRRLRSHEASPGVTAGADAAQAREAALREAHKAILAMDTKKDEDLTYNLAVLRAAEKVRRLIGETRT